MTESPLRTLLLSRSNGAILLSGLAISAVLLASRPRDYAGFHAILDTGAFFLLVLLALLFSDVGMRLHQALSRFIAIGFTVTSLLEFIHMMVGVEWSGGLSFITQAANVLRPTTWPPTAYILPIAIGSAVGFARSGERWAWVFTFGLLTLAAGFLVVFRWLPQYTPPGWLAITRPTLIFVPVLTAATGWLCWRRRSTDRALPVLALMFAVLLPAHLFMLYSSVPHDTIAMVAHVAKLCAYLIVLLTLMRLASSDMLDRIRAESQLARMNEGLEQRVAERTTDLATVNRHLQQQIDERIRTEANLRDSEARVSAILESALSAVIVMSVDGKIKTWNARAEEIFGWSEAEALGRELADTIIPARLREAHRRGLQRFVRTLEGPALNRLIEMEALHRSGREFPVDLSITVIRTGDTLSFCGFVTDTSERKKAAADLEANRRLLQSILDNSTAVVYVKDTAGRYLLVNSRFEEIFNLKRAHILGKTDGDLFDKQHADAFQAVDREVLLSARTLQMEEIAPQSDGVHTYISVKSPLFGADGIPYALCGISTDITELKLAELKQRQQLAQLQLLNRITHAAGERQDLTSILQVVLRSLEDDLPVDFVCVGSYESDAAAITIIGVGVKSLPLAMELMLPENARVVVDENGLSRCLRGQLVYEPNLSEVTFPFPERLTRGGLRSLVITPLGVESRVFGVLVVARRTAHSFTSSECEFLRQLGENVALAMNQAEVYGALQRAYDDLRQSQQAVMQQERLRALGQLSSGIAHDVNNAILPVTLYTEMLLERESGLSARGREQIETIQRAIEDVAKTVSHMRDFSRPREAELLTQSVDLSQVVTQVIELTKARLSDEPHQRGVVIDVRTDLSPEPPLMIGSENEIRGALTNLIFNAVDAMPNGGTLSIITRKHSTVDDARGLRASIEVRDTGIGMDEETRRRCLEPYFTTKGERGTGLGLAMVYGTVQRHGADLEIESTPGTGTTVRIVFSRPASVIAPSDISEVPLAIKPLRLLLVDDDPIVLKTLRDVLDQEGHLVTTADGGRAAVDAFAAAVKRGETFDAVITDLGMPYVDGRKVAAEIRALSARTPIIMLTGWGQRLVSENATPPQVDRVLSKPPKLDELRRALAALLSPNP